MSLINIKLFSSVRFWLSFITSAVPKLQQPISRLLQWTFIDTQYVVAYTVTSLYGSFIPPSIGLVKTSTCILLFSEAFFFTDALSGSYIFVALRTSYSVTLQLGRCLIDTFSCMWRSLGWPMMAIRRRAFFVFLTLRFANNSVFPATVLAIAASFDGLTSCDAYSPSLVKENTFFDPSERYRVKNLLLLLSWRPFVHLLYMNEGSFIRDSLPVTSDEFVPVQVSHFRDDDLTCITHDMHLAGHCTDVILPVAISNDVYWQHIIESYTSFGNYKRTVRVEGMCHLGLNDVVLVSDVYFFLLWRCHISCAQHHCSVVLFIIHDRSE